jgi:photosystem II stability/assembly factor-like uncharacterized protein
MILRPASRTPGLVRGPDGRLWSGGAEIVRVALPIPPRAARMILGGRNASKVALWYSDNLGRHWQAASYSDGGSNEYVRCVAHFGGDVLGAGTHGYSDPTVPHIALSTDRGKTWANVFTATGWYSIEDIIYSRIGIALALALKFVGGLPVTHILQSTDTGVNWSDAGATPRVFGCLAAAGNGVVCAGVSGVGDDRIYRSTDDGATWAMVKDVTRYSSFVSMYYLGNGKWIATGGRTYISSDHGASWTQSAMILSRGSCVYGIDAGKALIARWSSETSKGIYRTEDYGDTWFLTYASGGSYLIEVLASDIKGDAYAAGQVGVPNSRYSANVGKKWRHSRLPNNIFMPGGYLGMYCVECLRPERVL